ncbi:nitrate reductase [Ferrovibrio sp.]|uniref:nitrate reductase n=1 Tax=Ferrovibrio sp. TaxID=1917215 RepID=UPI00261D74CE|nr:nitrate reductase [Ferrovibrio sp.]
MGEAAPEIRSTCPYCGVGCGLRVRRDSDGVATVRGDEAHPANFGRTCSKGAALAETIGLEGRLLHPVMDGVRVGWDAALDRVAEVFSDTIAQHGPDSVAFYVSGQFLTEDYYVANKLMKGFIGSGNIDTNSRLCMASAVAGHKRAFGSDTVPGVYDDLEQADLVVLVGSNLAWCHPVLFQRLMAAKTERPEMTIVVIDPRRTMTARNADLHLALKPGSDVALFNGLLAHLHEQGRIDNAFVGSHTGGMEAALAAARSLAQAEIAAITGLSQTELRQFYDLFARHERVVTAYSQGVNQSSNGTDKVNAIINCHLFTGRIGRPGMGPFSVTGQPNAMGGREVGGLANQLACHMELDNPDHRRIVQDFWAAPRIADRPGLKAVDLFRAVKDGRVKAVWIAGTNPVDSLPDADDVQAALQACPFVVVSDVLQVTDTARHAHVLLPAAAWGEKDGTVTNSERRISRQRGFLPLPGEARPDWWIFAQVGRRMGWPDAFAYGKPAEIFAEYARLSGVENQGRRDFDISALGDITPVDYDALMPFQWPWPAGQPCHDARRFFADGQFYTPDRKARFIATPWRAAAELPTEDCPLVLNTGRIRDQWHTMTRTGRSPRLMGHIAEPFLEIHPADAAAHGIAPASLVVLRNQRGHAILRALVGEEQQRGTVFAPLHWTDQFSAKARIDALVNPATDPVSGQPELKFTPVAVQPYAAAWYGFAALRNKPASLDAGYWTLAPARDGWRLELADENLPRDWTAFARMLFGIAEADPVELLAYHDAAAGQHRFAAFRGDHLIGALFVAPQPVAVSRAWAAEQLGAGFGTAAERLRLLAGRAGAEQPDRGAIVCACFDVGARQIAAAAAGGCQTVEAVTVATQAGGNCGSCRSEIRRIIDGIHIQKAG